MGDQIEGAGGDGKQSFALEEIEKVAVEAGMDLDGVAAVFDNVGIDEAGDAAFAEEGFAEMLGQGGGESVGRGFGFRLCRHAKS